MAFVYPFDHRHGQPPRELKALLGGKGADLAEMTSVLELPVPPGFTITTEACRSYLAGGWPDGLDDEIAEHVADLETTMGRRLGDASDPLLVSVRSGAPFSMPGMMDTVLNLGLNDEAVEGLAKQTSDERFAYDSYRRLIAMFGRIVLDTEGAEFDELFDAAKSLAAATSDDAVPAELLRYLVRRYQQLTGATKPAKRPDIGSLWLRPMTRSSTAWCVRTPKAPACGRTRPHNRAGVRPPSRPCCAMVPSWCRWGLAARLRASPSGFATRSPSCSVRRSPCWPSWSPRLVNPPERAPHRTLALIGDRRSIQECLS